MPTKFIDPKPIADFDGPDFRYSWSFTWDKTKPVAAWLMMNPSKADSDFSDLTIDRVLHFSRTHGCGRATVVNLWPTMTPDSRVMWRAIPAVPSDKICKNRSKIAVAGAEAQLRVVAFGLNAGRDHRAHVEAMVSAFGDNLMCLGASCDGWPYHPRVRGKLWIPDDRRLTQWQLPTLSVVATNSDLPADTQGSSL